MDEKREGTGAPERALKYSPGGKWILLMDTREKRGEHSMSSPEHRPPSLMAATSSL